jgi:hypothetical protein
MMLGSSGDRRGAVEAVDGGAIFVSSGARGARAAKEGGSSEEAAGDEGSPRGEEEHAPRVEEARPGVMAATLRD